MLRGLLIAIVLFAVDLSGELVAKENPLENAIDRLYQEINPGDKLEQSIFERSMLGYYNMKKNGLLREDSVITIIDYRKASTENRFFVISLADKKILYATIVAHGKNSGGQFAESFSNKPGSKKSSIGFFVTEKSYYGKHGYSLKLEGVEPGFNDNAMQRAIVIHGADYVSQSFIERHGRLGRSWDCPALPQDITRLVIDEIKGGSCLFVYAEDQDYLKKSTFFNKETATRYYLKTSEFTTAADFLDFKTGTVEPVQP